MPYRNDVPIVQRLRPDDRVVIIKSPRSPHSSELIGGTDLEERVLHAVGASDAAVLVTVAEVTGELVDEGRWVETKVWAGVQEVIFSGTLELYRGADVAIHHTSGGETQIGSVHVKAGLLLNVRRGSTYLVFLARDPDQAMRWYPQFVMLEVSGTQLVDTWRHLKRAGIRDPLDGVALSRAIGLIREEAERKQRRRRER